MRIYVTDRNIPYKTTRIKALESKSDIDGLLAKWGIKRTEWNWDLENEIVELRFQIREMLKDVDGVEMEVLPVAYVKCYPLWNKKTGRKHKKDNINWDVSMRGMFWYLKALLLAAYLHQTSITRQFLSHVEIPNAPGLTVGDAIVKRMNKLKSLPEAIKTYYGDR